MEKSLKDLLKQAKPYLKFKYDRLMSIILPIFLIMLSNYIIISFDGRPWNKQYSEFYDLIKVGLIQPFVEEFLLRGILFGVILLFLVPLIIKQSKNKDIKTTPYILSALLFQSLIFAVFHSNPELINFTIRLFGGLIYGFLYLYYGNNLLPPTIAHTTHNLLINLGFYY